MRERQREKEREKEVHTPCHRDDFRLDLQTGAVEIPGLSRALADC
jgi:hypothetical protein